MRTVIKALLGFVLVVVLVLLVLFVNAQSRQRERRNDALCAAEGHKVAEEFLRVDAEATLQLQSAFRALGLMNDFNNVAQYQPPGALKDGYYTNDYDLGAFLGLEGTGYSYSPPSWLNLQGYEYLDLNRTAVFSKNAFPVRVIVRGGTNAPRVENDKIFVSLPAFRH